MDSIKTWSSAVFGSTLADNTALQLTWTILRLCAGVLMIHNGLGKLADVNGFAENVVAFIGFPFPVFFTYCAAYTEIIAAILLAIGLLTRPAAAALLFTMVIAIYFHVKDTGLDIGPYETASLYALSYLVFLVNGGGLFSLDALIAKQLSE